MLLFRLQESRPRVDGRGRLHRNHCSAVRRLFSEYFFNKQPTNKRHQLSACFINLISLLFHFYLI